MAARCRIRRRFWRRLVRGGGVAAAQSVTIGEAYAMADVISGGRLDFGIGKGSEPVEYRKFGMNRDEATQRFTECTKIIRQAWSDGPVSFHGEFYNYEGVDILPKPLQRPHPRIWVGATRSEETFCSAGANGYDLMTVPFVHPTTGALRDLVLMYRSELARAAMILSAAMCSASSTSTSRIASSAACARQRRS
jgi:alkanesulfonate monooxygenase SsuD/methylene tetrahydromethanopterin reductase-like flavin-dependent oxidoreductase (luciferase family)